MRILLYGNGSSGNHGCEAIFRGTISLLGEKNQYTINSADLGDDRQYGLCDISTLVPARQTRNKDFRFLRAYLSLKLKGNYLDMDGLNYLPGISQAKRNTDIALSVGGDNYCYEGTEIYGWLNQAYHKAGIKTILWGCSIEPNIVNQNKIAKDLSQYDLIVARESITYEAVKHVQKNTILAPDPAFFMEPKECDLDERLKNGNVIGINASPHILKCEAVSGMAYENYKHLIQYILSETDATIALIPHVVWASNDDRKVLQQLYDDFDQDPRLVLVEDHSAPELKYMISKCSFFVGARTHATIAAYSSCVPTLVVGYSVKARGIARDLFGTEKGYVLPVQSLNEPGQLSQAFQSLYEKRTSVSNRLMNVLPSYCSKASAAVKSIKELEKREAQ